MRLDRRLKVTGMIEFRTAFHLGSGGEGAGASDLGVLTDHEGTPLLPGSSLKGVFRSTAESLAEHLGMRACFLEREHPWCAGGSIELGRKKLKQLETARGAEVDAILAELCDVCRLFGSSLARGKLSFHDAVAESWAQVLEVRDGVGIDRDSGTAVDKVKYDYEVVPAGARFRFTMGGENLTDGEFALVAVVVREWARGVQLGGMTSRGLGAAVLEDVRFETVELADPSQRLEYLLNGTMRALEPERLETLIRQTIEVGNA
jgi:CRISPR-associated RAMP protein (TIGR02581 family)